MNRLKQEQLNSDARSIVEGWMCRYGIKNIKRLMKAVRIVVKEKINKEKSNGKENPQ